MTEQEAHKIIKQEIEKLGWTYRPVFTYLTKNQWIGVSYEEYYNADVKLRPMAMVKINILTKEITVIGENRY